MRLVHIPGHLADIHMACRRDQHVTRPRDISPDSDHFARPAEDLNPVVFSIAHEYPIVSVNPHTVGQAELTRPRARLAPRLDQLAVAREAVHPRVSVAI